MAKKVQYTTNQPSSTTDYLAADNTWKPYSGGSGGGGIPHGSTTGTDTYTTTISGVTSLSDGDAFLIRFVTGNTTGCTLNINSLGAKTLYRNNDGALIGGDIVDGAEMLCVYNSTSNSFQVIGTAPNTLLSYVTNAESTTITKGQAVYAFGGQGDRLKVKLAYNTSDATSAQTIGIVLSSSIGANQKGLIIMQGQIDGLSLFPTSTWADGDAVYLGATAGSFSHTKPLAPNHLVYLGFVTTASNGSAGRMYVRVQNGYEMDELHNVSAVSPNNDDILKYNTSTSLWETSNALSTKQDTITGAASTITSSNLTNYRALVSDGGGKVAVAATTSTEIGYLSGVTSNIQTQLNSKISGSISILSFQLANVINASTTTWIGVGVTGGTNESTATVIMPVACTLSDMYTMHYNTTQPASGSQVFTVRKNGVDTALAITISAGSVPTTTPYSNTSNSVTFAAGDKLSIRRVNNATTTGGAVNGLSFKLTI